MVAVTGSYRKSTLYKFKKNAFDSNKSKQQMDNKVHVCPPDLTKK